MINIDPTILIIMGEAILALVVVMVGIIAVMLRTRKRDRDAVAELQARLKKNAPKRQEWYESVLDNSIENGDADANRELAKSWVEKENRFYTHLVDMYMKRNSEALRGLDKLLHEYSSSYLELVSLMRTRIDEEQQSVPDDVREQLERLAQEGERLGRIVETLEQENQRLSTELDGANKEIDQAMREYSVAFRPGSGMTGSAIAAAPEEKAAVAAMPVMEMAADSFEPMEMVESAPEEIELPEPEVEMAVDPDEFAAELDELSSEIMAETADVTATEETDVVEEMDLAAFDAIPEPQAEIDVEPETTAAEEEWPDNFDELPDVEAAVDEETVAAPESAVKGPVIDLADEGDIVLPQLNELMESIELPDSTADDEMAGDLLDNEGLPVLEESVDVADGMEEDKLLAQLEGLDEIDLPSFSGDINMDEMDDLNELPVKNKDAPAKS